jgi:integrase/recombinase XerD
MEEIQSIEYQKLIKEFVFFLETTGYAHATIVSRQRHLKEFLLYLEEQGVNTIKEINNKHLQCFMEYQHQRENRVYGSALKTSSINQYSCLLNKLMTYLRDYKHLYHLSINIPYIELQYRERQTLTCEQIAELFAFTFEKMKQMRYQTFYGQRNRAMLAVYYCCGLRKSEGVNLEIKDIQSDRLTIHVRKGKGNRERYVPVTAQTMQLLTEYMHGERARTAQQNETQTEQFFITEFGTPCTGQAISMVFRSLIRRCGNSEIQAKQPSLHTLRHSIATHLLQQGMDIVLIQQF